MDKVKLLTFPEIPKNPSNYEYFIHQLPYAYPGLITFLIGFFLMVFSFYSFIKNKKPPEKSLYLSFSVLLCGVSFLGLVLGLRAVILDEKLLLSLNYAFYPLLLLLVPGMAHFIYEITEKRYKTLNYLAAFLWITVILALIGLFSGEAFLDDFHQYNFGQYPKSDLYLKSWALLGSFSFIIGIIFLWIYSRNFKEKVPEKRIVFLWYFSFLSFNYFKPP